MVTQVLLLSRSEYQELPKLIWFLRGKKIKTNYMTVVAQYSLNSTVIPR